MAKWADVKRIVAELPETSEATSYGKPSWSVRDKVFAFERPLRTADFKALGDAAPAGAILGVHLPDLEMKEALLASQPEHFFTTPHFDGYAAILVRLDSTPVAALRSVLIEGWLARAPQRLAAEYLAQAKPPARKRHR